MSHCKVMLQPTEVCIVDLAGKITLLSELWHCLTSFQRDPHLEQLILRFTHLASVKVAQWCWMSGWHMSAWGYYLPMTSCHPLTFQTSFWCLSADQVSCLITFFYLSVWQGQRVDSPCSCQDYRCIVTFRWKYKLKTFGCLSVYEPCWRSWQQNKENNGWVEKL